MNFTKLFVGAFALSAMLVACDSDSASAKDTELEELSSSSVIASEATQSSSTIRNDSLSSSAIESSSSSAIEIASSSSTIRNDSSSSSVMETSSSSETTQSSSSSENISAGSVYDAIAKTLKDLRDGKTYKTVTIGTQTWMAENLNYETGNSYCYGDDASYCSKYGRLYTWSAAMDSVGTWTTNGKGCGYGSKCSPTGTIRGICPEGWHLPSKTEWSTLFTAVGGESTAGKVLKSQTGWYDSGNGTDSFGFSALSAGYRGSNGRYYYKGSNAYFWSSTEYDGDYAYNVYLHYYDDNARLNYYINKDHGRSVRCVKD